MTTFVCSFWVAGVSWTRARWRCARKGDHVSDLDPSASLASGGARFALLPSPCVSANDYDPHRPTPSAPAVLLCPSCSIRVPVERRVVRRSRTCRCTAAGRRRGTRTHGSTRTTRAAVPRIVRGVGGFDESAAHAGRIGWSELGLGCNPVGTVGDRYGWKRRGRSCFRFNESRLFVQPG